MYHENEQALLPIVLMANLVYGVTTLYYQIVWKLDLKLSKPEYIQKIKQCLKPDCQSC